MKKILIILIIIAIIAGVVFFVLKNNKNKKDNNAISKNRNAIENSLAEGSKEIAKNSIDENKVNKKEETKKEETSNMNEIYIKVNNQILEVELEENSATKELIEKLQSKEIVIEAREYGGFEKVGDLGFTLPKEDTNIKTEAGDIVLYQGNQISLFYNSNSWSYTKLGKIKNISSNELKNILGNGDVTLTFTLSK